eukprot:763373-Hanusia_phi.AAC.4
MGQTCMLVLRIEIEILWQLARPKLDWCSDLILSQDNGFEVQGVRVGYPRTVPSPKDYTAQAKESNRHGGVLRTPIGTMRKRGTKIVVPVSKQGEEGVVGVRYWAAQ